MPKAERLWRIFGIDEKSLTKKERILLEADLWLRIHHELNKHFLSIYKEYFFLIKQANNKENDMFEHENVKMLIQDIIRTGEYTLEGIAYYTYTCVDVLQEILYGKCEPSARLLRNLIELHRSVFRDFYTSIIEKVKKEMF